MPTVSPRIRKKSLSILGDPIGILSQHFPFARRASMVRQLQPVVHLDTSQEVVEAQIASQVIQSGMTFSSPIVGGHQQPLKRVTFSPSQKGHGLNHQEEDFVIDQLIKAVILWDPRSLLGRVKQEIIEKNFKTIITLIENW